MIEFFRYLQEKREQDNTTYIKSDLHIFAKPVSAREPEKDEKYVMIGYYNNDQSRFKDILTNTVVTSQELMDKKYSKLNTYFNPREYSNSLQMPDQYITSTNGNDWANIYFAHFSNFDYTYSYAPGFRHFSKLCASRSDKPITTKEIKAVAKELDKAAYKYEFNKFQRQTKKEQTQEGYSKEF
ncbi:MAG: hypothetical protein IJA61_01465 [Clostridia bacterium]|nr:hypothetical protein [Clostridia bacterium]